MADLPKIVVERKNGKEQFTLNEQSLDFTLSDFWGWSVSDLVSNATRGRLAEFIVATALELDIKTLVRNEWDEYDLEIPGGSTIEVKSAAYLQSWSQSELSKICFSIKASKWDTLNNKYFETPVRQANVYVFCLLKHKDKKNEINPLNLDQWEFYVVPTEKLNNYSRSQTSITLRSLESLTPLPVSYNELKKTILEISA